MVIVSNYFVYFSADWYKGRLTDKQLDELENPPTPRPKATKVSRRKQRPRKPVVEEEEEE